MMSTIFLQIFQIQIYQIQKNYNNVNQFRYIQKYQIFCLNTVSYNDISKTINTLKINKYFDAYGFNSDLLIIPLSKLINICITIEYFTKFSKNVKAIAIHRKSPVDDMNNFLPISKLPENLLRNQIMHHFESNNFY